MERSRMETEEKKFGAWLGARQESLFSFFLSLSLSYDEEEHPALKIWLKKKSKKKISLLKKRQTREELQRRRRKKKKRVREENE